MKCLFTVAVFTSILVSASCSKNESAGSTKTELLVSAPWKYNDAGLDVNKDGFIDTGLPPGYLYDCDKDNTITFKNDGTGIIDEGAVKCDPANPQTTPFTWTFKNGETVINFPTAVLPNISGDVTIHTLTSTELVLLKEINIGTPTTINVIMKLKH